MANSGTAPSGFGAVLRGKFVNPDGTLTSAGLQLLRDWDKRLTNGLNEVGQLVGEIDAGTLITGRNGSIGAALQNVNPGGVVQPTGITPASDSKQGGVILPAGTTSNTLGTAAVASSTDFDPAGAADTAQSNAEGFAAAAAATAQANAQTFASNASNLTSGTVSTDRLPGISATIVTAALTVGGTQGLMTFTNGVLTAQTPAS